MKGTLKTILRIILLTLPVLLTPNIPYAADYTIGQQVGIASSPNPVGSGARAVGMGGAFIGIADDATAASWNPAGLTQLEKPELSLVGGYFCTSEDYSSSSNPVNNTSSHTSESSINYLSAAYPFNFLNKNMVVSVNYQRLYEFNRHFDYNNQETTYPFPTFPRVTKESRTYEQSGYLSAVGLASAIQITPSLSFGGTLNLWTGQLGWQNGWDSNYSNHSVTTFGLTKTITDSHIAESYSDVNGVNVNLGLLWSANQHLTVGAVLKTPFSAKFDHQYTYDSVQRDRNGNITNSSHVSVSDEVSLWMPLSCGIGVAWRFSDHLTVDLDAYWTQWSQYMLTDGQGNKMNPINALPESQSDIKDTTQIRIGGEYLFIKPDRNWVASIRGGMFYDPEPAQGKVNDFYGVSIGSGIGYQRYVFDVAYQLRWGKDVSTGNLIPASNADITQNLILASFILHF